MSHNVTRGTCRIYYGFRGHYIEVAERGADMVLKRDIDTHRVARQVVGEFGLEPDAVTHFTVIGLMDELYQDHVRAILVERLGRELGHRVAQRIINLVTV